MTYDLNQPPHKVVNQVVRRLEDYLFDTDIKVKFGDEGRTIIEGLIEQYNADASKQYDEIGHLSMLVQQHESAAKAMARWAREHGYLVAQDVGTGCWRIVLEGIDRKDDEFYPTEFKKCEDAYYWVFKLIAGSK